MTLLVERDHDEQRSTYGADLRMLAVDGLGVAFLPEWLVNEDIEAGRLRRVLPEWSSGPITAWAIHRTELRGSPRLRAFLDALPSDTRRAPTRTSRSR